jgi:excinuclease ABC subunit A
VIQNPELSLAGGAIRGWDRRNFYYFQMLKSLAEHYKFDVEAPWHPEAQRAESGPVRFRQREY